MAGFSNVSYSGTYGASGSGVDVDGAFTVVSSGTLITILSQDAAGNLSGTWSYSGQATATYSDGPYTISVSDSGSVSGTGGNLSYSSTGGVFVNGVGQLTNGNTTISLTASFVFDGGSGSASGTLTGSPPADTTPPVEDPATVTFDDTAPTPVQWSESSVVVAEGVFVSPQYTVDEATGEWSLASYPGTPGGSFGLADVAYFTGIARDRLVDTVKDAAQEEVNEFIEDQLGEHQGPALTSLFQTAQMAHQYYDAVSTLAESTIGLLADVPAAVVGLTSPDEINARIDAIHQQFSEDLAGILLPGYVMDAVKAVKWFLQRSDYVFGLQTASGAYVGAEHRDLLIGGTENDAFSGGANDDMAFGSGGNDTLGGGEGSDQLDGGAGGDSLDGGAGNDTLTGGSGTDTAAYGGSRSSYTITRTDSGYTVSGGAEGTDTLAGVERLQFANASVGLDIDGTGGECYRIYKAAFNRVPDGAGLGYWIAQMDQGMDLIEVSARFIDSAEFRSLYGTNPSNGVFLTNVYRNVLGRDPDTEGYAWWTDQLANNPEKTWQKVLADFSESSENQDNVIGLIGNGFEYTAWTG